MFASLHSMKGLWERLKGAGVSALSAFHYFPFNYQQRHAHNYFISQLRWYCAIVSMDEFRNINALMVQLGTSCVFDSPGLARSEPTPGKRLQGDSTPSVLSFFCEGMLITRRLMANYSKKRNTYGVVPHKPYVNPG